MIARIGGARNDFLPSGSEELRAELARRTRVIA
jgi:hypothetical protein